MIRRLLARLLPGGKAAPRIYSPSQHLIRRDQISAGAQQVIRRLQGAGFQAFVVGGAVRDLLVGMTPMDFDVATDATPEDVKPLFRRAFIIGRRFKLVHVLSGSETIEVATYRGRQLDNDAADEHGRLLTDNVFGTQAEDSIRRDFTVNALYFDPTSEEVWDYVGGVKDIKAERMRLIGPPVTRYREDPLRMLRAVRLAAKLGFSIDKKTAEPIQKLAPLMRNIPPARLFDEMLKLLLSGHAVETLKSLQEHGLHHGLLPLLDVILEQPLGQRFIELALTNTDERVRAGKPVSPAFMFAALLWHEVLAKWTVAKAGGARPIPALFEAMDQAFDQQAAQLAIPRRFEANIKEIWALQPRFEQRSRQRAFRLLSHPRFRAGFDFLSLRAQSGELQDEFADLGDWWEGFQHSSDEERDALLKTDEEPKKRTRGRSRSRGRKKTEEDVPSSPASDDHQDS